MYHINSLSMNSDGETFLSADDLRINIWNIEVSNHSFCTVDIKPPKMTELNEVITCAEFHPKHCNLLTYGSSKGFVYIADMRAAALCEKHAKSLLDDTIDLSNRGYFSEIIASISDLQFTGCGRYMYTRDYMTVKLWDLRMERGPVSTHPVHENLREEFCELFENDCIFDKFDLCLDPSGTKFATGTYGNSFKIKGLDSSCLQLSATRNPMLKKSQNKEQQRYEDPFAIKLLHMSWHPKRDIIAVAASNSLYIYSAKQCQTQLQ
eukprot:TRINITY_DN7522_c0_g2_i1.p1 TRINITY_DN7522_c0_g2~~TRINITY_DN7522_c0_g2_i1.p1  ORF type:complete len:264 (-),score=16.89 TRINITY_DN7522_c0_g2_i1:326-1117(-)